MDRYKISRLANGLSEQGLRRLLHRGIRIVHGC